MERADSKRRTVLISLMVPLLPNFVVAGQRIHSRPIDTEITQQGKSADLHINEPEVHGQGQILNTLGLEGLVAHWTLNEADYDGRYLDTVAGYTAQPAGEPNFVEGVRDEPNGAVMVTPSTGWGLSEAVEGDFSDGLTICLWVNWNGDQEEAAGTSDLTMESGGSEYVVNNSIKADQRWQHVCVTYENGVLRFYLNGQLRLNQACELPTGDEVAVEIGNTERLQILNGAIDDIRLYNYALGQTEITQLVTGEENCTQHYSHGYDVSGPYGLPDCAVDSYDLAGLSKQWLENCPPEYDLEYDFSGPQGLPDCTVNLYDLAEFCNNWLSSGW